MIVSLFAGVSITANAEDEAEVTEAAVAAQADTEETAEAAEADDAQPVEKVSNVKSVFNSNMYVEANEGAGLDGKVAVSFNSIGTKGTLYLPGSADPGQLFFCWDDKGITVSNNGTVYESGTAPVAAAGESIKYKITKGLAVAYITVKTDKGSEAVEGMFLELDESMGTIAAMNADKTHETQCFGSVKFDDSTFFISMKGRGNSTWGFDKKPYNLTFFKANNYAKKQAVELIDGVKAKKWSLLANYLDNSLLRNKIALDLAQQLGIGLDARFVDLWMNGEYLGNYLMTPKNDYAAPDGGYVLENDNYLDAEDPQFLIPGMFEVGEPIHDDGYYNRMTVKAIGDDAADAGVDAAAIEEWFDEAWATVLDYDSDDYQKYFDIDSWAKMFLMYEVSKIYDCMSGSLLMHRDGLTENDKLIAGPTWDYDTSFGRSLHKFLCGVSIPNQMTAEGWFNDGIGLVSSDTPISMLQELGKHASFMKRVAEVFNEYKWAFDDVVNNIDKQRALVKDSALMNNDLWGTHHLGAYYIVTPAFMGTGKYMVQYEVTANWNAYVNNMREFAQKRVLWLADHLYAEQPVGEITKTLNEKDCVVELKAVIASGNQTNTFQWQRCDDGKNWTDIEGATKATCKVAVGEATDEVQYRCVVKNAGVDICTTHGGKVKASAQTILAPVMLDVSIGVAVTETTLCDGKLVLVMDGREIGEYVFAACENGWTVCNEKGKYLAADGYDFTLSSNPFVWSFENGVFTADVKVSYTRLGKWLGIGHTESVYLAMDGDKFAVSDDNGSQASFLLRTEYVIE